MEPDGQFPNVTQTPNPEVPGIDGPGRGVGREHQRRPGPGHRPRRRPPRRHGSRDRDRALSHFVDRQRDRRAADAFQADQAGRAAADAGRRRSSIKTLVTTALVTRIARHFKAQVVENLLVGFKYVAEVLWQLEQNGGYEDVAGHAGRFRDRAARRATASC